MGKVFGCVLVAFCYLAMTDAAVKNSKEKVKGKTTGSPSEMIRLDFDKVKATYEELKKFLEAIKENGEGCFCYGLTSCQCCVEMLIARVCVNLSFDPKAETVTVSVTVNGHTDIKKTFSTWMPTIPPLCFKYGKPKICSGLYDFNVDSKGANGCAKITVTILFTQEFDINVGCFQLNFLGKNPVVEA